VTTEASGGMTCLPLLSRLGEGKGADDPEQQCPVKEEIVVMSDLAQPGFDLNIGLPVGGSCIEDAVMGAEKADDEEEDNEVVDDDDGEDGDEAGEEWTHQHAADCKVEGVDQLAGIGEVAMASVEGWNAASGFGEFGVVGAESGLPIGCRYWIPTPAQILIGPVQFICHVCNKTFNRYNNMQVRIVLDLLIYFTSRMLCWSQEYIL
jgi:hypothetical protein